MNPWILILIALVSLSESLTTPIDGSAMLSPLLNGTNTRGHQATSVRRLLFPSTNITAVLLGAWPSVPFSSVTGGHLNITITYLGRAATPATGDQILNDISAIHLNMAHEGNHYATIDRAYARSHGIVSVFYGSRPGADLKLYEAIRVISLVRFLMIVYEPREIFVSEITLDGKSLATFALRFFEAEA